MKNKNVLILPGDGVGPEVMNEAIKIIDFCVTKNLIDISYQEADIGGIAIDKYNSPLPDQTLEIAKNSSCILLGAVGTKKHENNQNQMKPETGLLKIRKELDLFINIRPIFLFDALVDSSTLKAEFISDLDIVIIRELVSDIYFGTPRGFGDDRSYAYNTMRYTREEIERIAKFAFELSKKRSGNLTSVDKANVLETSQLWRQVVTELGTNYSDVDLTHMYVDNAAMQLIKNPKQFDVLLTGNIFGDILSDEASMLTGSIGMLPSASLSSSHGMYEPIHGSAPDIAGQNTVNPIAMILSVAMMFEYTFERKDISSIIRQSINSVLNAGFFTKDLSTHDFISTNVMGDKILQEIQKNV